MTTIKHIDRRNLVVIEEAILAKLRESLGADFGLEFNFKGGNFSRDGGNAVLKLEIAIKNSDGSAQTRSSSNFKRLAESYGLKPEHFGATFTVGRESYKITGLEPKRYSMPISAERVRDGRGFKFSADQVVTALGVKPAAKSVLNLIAPPTASERIQVEEMIAELKANNPEAYYADGERSETKAHRDCFQSFLRQIRSGNQLPPMFGKK